jgi:O-antigen ligase
MAVVALAAGLGWVATTSGELSLLVGLALGAVVVVAIALAGRHPGQLARLLLWGGLLFSLGFKPPRRTGAEVVERPLTFANTVPFVVLVIALTAALILASPRLLPLSRVERWLGLFLGAAVLSALWSVSPAHSLLRATTLVLSYLCVVLLVRIERANGRDPMHSLAGVTHLLIAATVVGVAVFPGQALSPIPGSLIELGRLKGVMPYVHPNALAFLAVLSIVFAWSGMGLGRRGHRIGVRLAVIGVDLGVVLATRTRSALVFLVLALALTVLLDPRLRQKVVLLLPSIAALAFVVLQLSGSSIGGFVARGQDAESLRSLTGRVDEWDNALRIAGDAPLTGLGYYAGHRFGPLAEVEGELNTTTDNAWMDVFIDTGLLGLVPLTVAVGTGGLLLVRRYRAAEPDAVTTLVVYAVCLAASFVNPSLNEANYWMLAFVVVLVGGTSGAPLSRPSLDQRRVATAR